LATAAAAGGCQRAHHHRPDPAPVRETGPALHPARLSVPGQRQQVHRRLGVSAIVV
jgi:hypothetical protein